MSSLLEKISELTNPAPKILDPEDEDNIDAAKVSKFNTGDEEALFEKSELRSKAAVLQDFYPELSGKKVSRKSLGDFFHDDDEEIEDEKIDNLSRDQKNDFSFDQNDISVDDSDEDDDDDEEEEEDELNDDDLENFKSSVMKQSVVGDDENDWSKEEDESEESEESEASDIESNEDLTNKFSNIDVESEMEKGAAVKSQQELWHRLCEARIKLQKLLIVSNKLPQSEGWKSLKMNAEEELLQCINKGSNSVKVLLNNCLNLQAEILRKIPEINSKENDVTVSDEEIPSDTEEETEDLKQKNPTAVEKTLKRKLKCDEYGDIVTKRFKSLIPYRNSVIQKWDEKTKLSSGRITQKSFSTFEGSALKQIEQILQDESRLIKRTQLKRSLYRVLGKSEDSELKSEEKTENNESQSKQDMLLRDYDSEIFDDDDFYRQLLKDVIESKSVGIDPLVLRKQMEIQNVRNKIKKKIDTKASKGRKIRYDVHPKLVGFMKKTETSTLPDEERDFILKSMFGKCYSGYS